MYVYIDPRNLQEFYYGKGQDDRKLAHLNDSNDSEKTRIINEIKKENLEPIIKVVARGLTEEQAFLVEKTLIWKLGRTLTNQSSGHYAQNFRPHNTIHKDLLGFDYENGIYCLNVGEGESRHWDDCMKYGFMSAGQNWAKWGSKICALRPNDIVCSYLSGHGYVGVGIVEEIAVAANQFLFEGKLLSTLPLVQPNMLLVPGNLMDGEFVLKINWLSCRDRKSAVGGSLDVWRSRSMLGSLESQSDTLEFLEKEFGVNFKQLLMPSARAS